MTTRNPTLRRRARGRIRPSRLLERGFHRADPVPAGIAGRPDLFEEEYGQADVESAIVAFEKAAPRVSPKSEEGATATAMAP